MVLPSSYAFRVCCFFSLFGKNWFRASKRGKDRGRLVSCAESNEDLKASRAKPVTKPKPQAPQCRLQVLILKPSAPSRSVHCLVLSPERYVDCCGLFFSYPTTGNPPTILRPRSTDPLLDSRPSSKARRLMGRCSGAFI